MLSFSLSEREREREREKVCVYVCCFVLFCGNGHCRHVADSDKVADCVM